MSRIRYALLGAFLHTLALLPLWLLYRLSDIAGFLLCHVVRYRRTTVRKNLTESFPELSHKEINAIVRRFYRNFADYVVETIKLLHISDNNIAKRIHFEGLDIIDRHLAEGRSVACYFSHCGNWEWGTSVTLHSRYGNVADVAYCQVYRPLKNKWFDDLMLRLRSRFGSVSLPKRTTLRHLLEYRRNGVRTVTGFMSDQKPGSGDTTHILEFLNHPTAMISGTEQLARRLDMAAVYWDMYKPRRGHYHIVTRPMCDSAAATPEGYLTTLYADMLQQTIRHNPAIWLWSHKRWKNPVQMPPTASKDPAINNPACQERNQAKHPSQPKQ